MDKYWYVGLLEPSKYGYGVRHVQLAIFLLCFTVISIARGHMGVTIIAMTRSNKDNIVILNKAQVRSIDDLKLNNFSENVIYSRNQSDILIFNWSESVQEMILYAFAVGYMMMLAPMGILCQRYNNKLPLQIALSVTGIVCLLTPLSAEWGDWKAVCVSRLLQGLCQAGTYPSIQGLLGKWVSADESTTLSGFLHTGLYIGAVIGFQLGGIQGASEWGWPSTFYTIGILCILCFLVLTVWGSASPIEHKSITDEEKNYIMGLVVDGVNKKKQKINIPWREIFKSKSLCGAVTSHVGTILLFILFYNHGPTYIHFALGVNIRNSGILTSLPYFASIFSTLLFGWLSDYCTNKNIMTKTNARRIFNTIGHLGLAGCMVLSSYTRNYIVVVTLLIIGMSLNMSTNVGFMINYIDIAPNFSGTLTSIGSTITWIVILMLPFIVSYVVTDVTNIIQWRILIFIIAGVSVLTNCIFVLWVSTDVQAWNNDYQNDSSSKHTPEEIQIIHQLEKQSLP